MKDLKCLLLGLAGLVLIADVASAEEPKAAKEGKPAWVSLFDGKTLKGWRAYKKKTTGGWAVKDGVISLEKPGGGDLMTEKKYGDFEFTCEWKFVSGNNSGIIYRVSEEGGQTYHSGPEMQVMTANRDAKLGKTSAGSLYDMYAPTANPLKSRDEWNEFKVVCVGNHIEQWVNGVKVVDCEIGSKDWNERLAKSKWKKVKLFATQKTGHIALQDHGAKVMYRKLAIRELSAE